MVQVKINNALNLFDRKIFNFKCYFIILKILFLEIEFHFIPL